MTAPTRSAIPTTYRGTNFRSRLEARWAAFFDLVGWRWTYEPIDAAGYIPDFLIHGAYPFFVEVGPCIDEADYEQKAAKANGVVVDLQHDVLVVGVHPLHGPHSDRWTASAGWLGELQPAHLSTDCGMPPAECNHKADFYWSAGLWHKCGWRNCGLTTVHHEVGLYTSRGCGHYDGDHHLGTIDPGWLEAIWQRAGNDTQWQPESVGSIMRRLGR